MKSFHMTSEFLQPVSVLQPLLIVMAKKLLLQPRGESNEVLSVMSETAPLVYILK